MGEVHFFGGAPVWSSPASDAGIRRQVYWLINNNGSTESYVLQLGYISPSTGSWFKLSANNFTLSKDFPNAPVSPSTFSLFVANDYIPGEKHKICEHTDDQSWYASPPVFASVTFLEYGIKDMRQTYRFQIRDKTTNKIVDIPLPDSSICFMRADIPHRVLPPLKKFSPSKRRVNLTFRNLVDRTENPLGWTLALQITIDTTAFLS